jgi:putative ABC transport system substrate-binding protein
VELLQRSAKELVALAPDLILSSGTVSTAALLQQTDTIPVVFAVVVDPVGSGFIASVARPAGNVTGFMNLDPKWRASGCSCSRRLRPRTMRVAIPYNPQTESYAEIYPAPTSKPRLLHWG